MAAARTWRTAARWLLILAAAGAAAADEATVRLTDGRLLAGDVELYPRQLIVHTSLGKLTIARQEVAAINWLKPAFDARGRLMRALARLEPADLDAHVELARQAATSEQPELAARLCRFVLDQSPDHAAAAALLAELGGSAASQPSTQPAAAAEPPVSTPELLSARDILHIKLSEMRLRGEPDRMTVRFVKRSGESDLAALVYRQYARAPEMDTELERHLLRGTPGEKLQAIVALSGLRYADRINVRGSPEALLAFRQRVLPLVAAGCARSGCHGSKDARVFSLPTRSRTREANVYTTFALLDRMYTPIGPMIDREAPEESALLKYLMPQEDERRVHPPVGKRRIGGLVRGLRDRRYRSLVEWIASLRRPHPDYDLEYQWPAWMERFSPPEPQPAPADPDQSRAPAAP